MPVDHTHKNHETIPPVTATNTHPNDPIANLEDYRTFAHYYFLDLPFGLNRLGLYRGKVYFFGRKYPTLGY